MLEATKSPKSTPSGTDHATEPINPALAAEAKIARLAVTIFPTLVVLAGVAGFLVPAAFQPLGPSVPYLLGIIMFCDIAGSRTQGVLTDLVNFLTVLSRHMNLS